LHDGMGCIWCDTTYAVRGYTFTVYDRTYALHDSTYTMLQGGDVPMI